MYIKLKLFSDLLFGGVCLFSFEGNANAQNTTCLWEKGACDRNLSQCQEMMLTVNYEREGPQKEKDRKGVCEFIFSEKNFFELKGGDRIKEARDACLKACEEHKLDKSVDPCAAGGKICMSYAC